MLSHGWGETEIGSLKAKDRVKFDIEFILQLYFQLLFLFSLPPKQKERAKTG